MTKMPTVPLSWLNLIVTTLKAYPVIFVQIWFLVVLSACVHLVIPWLFLLNPTFGFIGLVSFVLLTWFFYTAILCKGAIALQQGHMPLNAAFRLAKRRYLAVLASNIIFFAIGALLIVFEYALDLIFDLVHQFPLFLGIAAAINSYIFITLYFAIPLIILDNRPVLRAFETSGQLVKNNWWRTFIVLLCMGLLVLGFEALGILFTGKNRMVLFTLYDFICQIIFYPLIVAATLIVLNDLQLRFVAKQAKPQPSKPMQLHRVD